VTRCAGERRELLRENWSIRATAFGADIPITEAVHGMLPRLTGHQQITDAYLVALAIHNKENWLRLIGGF